VNITKARRPIAVVDERTYRQAVRALDLLTRTGMDSDRAKAVNVCHAAAGWLRYEIHTGRKSKRADRAARLEQWELTLDQLRRSLGLPGPRRSR
jgi:hypothetical protein